MQITLATLEQATSQQVYDQVLNHIRKQRKQSMSGTACAYRGQPRIGSSPVVLACAAGCLMTDEEFEHLQAQHPINDKVPFNRTTWEMLASQGEVPPFHKNLITDLQGAHDRFEPMNYFDEDALGHAFMAQFEDSMRGIALLHKLTYTPPVV